MTSRSGTAGQPLASATASCAVNGAANTETSLRTAWPGRSSSAKLQSRADRSERCRSSIREPPASNRRRSASPASTPSRPSAGSRAAANSIASATPSSPRQIAATLPLSAAAAGMLPVDIARTKNKPTASPGPPSASETESPGTVNTHSYGTRSLALLVASTVSRGHAARSRSSSTTTASARCSQLSRTSSTSRPASQPRTVSSAERPCCSPRPSAAASVGATIVWSVTGTRSTYQAPSA